MLALAAFYAPRGIPPARVLAASPAERALLRAAREQYWDELHVTIHNAIVTALCPDAKEAERE